MVHPEHSNCSSNELKITILVFFNNNQERLDCNMDKTSILKSELRGIVVLLKDFKTEALLPVFEAVINSIQSIEERFGKDMKSGEIRVIVHRTLQPNLPEIDTRKEPEIISFEITDNGIGFTDRNMDSFKTVASSYKLEKGGKGIGRFTWLKAFENVEINSVYTDAGGKKRLRTILFSLDGLKVSDDDAPDSPQYTTVRLLGFKKAYQTAQSACRTGTKIAQRIMEHCLFYYIAQKNPEIILQDHRPNGKIQEVKLQSLFDEVKGSMTSDSLVISNHKFVLYHIKLYDSHAAMHKMVLCANERDVLSIGMEKLLGTSSQFDENDKRFTYAVYVAGYYLDKHVCANRTEFDLPAESSLDKDTPIGLNDLQHKVAESSKAFLAKYLQILRQKRVEIAQKYVSEKNPSLRAVLHYCPEALNDIEPTTQEEKIDEILYRYKGRAEYEIRRKSEKLLQSQKSSVAEIEKTIKDVGEQIDDFQKDNLVNYMIFRKLIIDLLDKKIKASPEGKFANEYIIHDVIFPRKATSDTIDYEHHNLWILDDRLAFHHFAASDLPLKQTMQTESEDRPDVVAFSDIDIESNTARSVSIIELKKPMREEYDESPIAQIIRMLKGIQGGSVLLQKNGRPININKTTRYYCYGLCDFTKKVHDFARESDYIELSGNLGYYNYHKHFSASIYLINYDMIVSDAQKRHYAFFNKLGLK